MLTLTGRNKLMDDKNRLSPEKFEMWQWKNNYSDDGSKFVVVVVVVYRAGMNSICFEKEKLKKWTIRNR